MLTDSKVTSLACYGPSFQGKPFNTCCGISCTSFHALRSQVWGQGMNQASLHNEIKSFIITWAKSLIRFSWEVRRSASDHTRINQDTINKLWCIDEELTFKRQFIILECTSMNRLMRCELCTSIWKSMENVHQLWKIWRLITSYHVFYWNSGTDGSDLQVDIIASSCGQRSSGQGIYPVVIISIWGQGTPVFPCIPTQDCVFSLSLSLSSLGTFLIQILQNPSIYPLRKTEKTRDWRRFED